MSELLNRHFAEGLRGSQNKFNRQPFQFVHNLAGHPLFQLPRVVELALSRPARDFYFDHGDARIDQRWAEMPARGLSLQEAIIRIRESNAWIVLSHAERDPQYRGLLDEVLDEALAGWRFRNQVKSREVIIFVSSPRRLTTYHIDRECNFLLQIAGEKTIHIFDREDRDVLSEEELERFWSIDNNAAKYKPAYQDRALTVSLTPGTGVHIPVNCPHWVQNGDDVSISVSINFQFHDWTRANVYRMNHAMRRLGFRPTPPGLTPWKDAVKGRGLTPLIAGRELMRKFKP